MEQGRDFRFSERDFQCLRGLVRRHAGINLSEAKRDMVYSRLSRRLRALGLKRFSDYCRLIEDEDPEELVNFTNAITTNLTAFFREPHHFDYLAGTLLPSLRATKADSRRLRIWSAACSTGEEPYSIAMVVKECLPSGETWDARILATDLDSEVLARAQAGIYAQERVAGLPPTRLRRWFLRGRGPAQEKVRVAPELQRMITFRQLNLLNAWPMKGPFDVIFCRNVVIYFDKPTQRALFDRIAGMLEIGGHLIVGHSESLYRVSDRFELIGKTVYRKTR